MREEQAEHSFLGKHKDKMWTYLILMILLIAIVLVINLVWQNPARASAGIKHFLGLPAWALAAIAFVVGALVFWGGLKVEADWPEALGAFLISGAIAWFELIVGWNRFDLGGMVVLPYLIPLVVFVLLLMYGMRNSV
jgi:hypothetical protein